MEDANQELSEISEKIYAIKNDIADLQDALVGLLDMAKNIKHAMNDSISIEPEHIICSMNSYRGNSCNKPAVHQFLDDKYALCKTHMEIVMKDPPKSYYCLQQIPDIKLSENSPFMEELEKLRGDYPSKKRKRSS